MATSHTPGPWEADRVAVWARERRHLICFVETFRGDEDNAEAEANARLIAAAPDLLAALHDLAPVAVSAGKLVGSGNNAEIVKRIGAARAAIAKAEGRS